MPQATPLPDPLGSAPSPLRPLAWPHPISLQEGIPAAAGRHKALCRGPLVLQPGDAFFQKNPGEDALFLVAFDPPAKVELLGV